MAARSWNLKTFVTRRYGERVTLLRVGTSLGSALASPRFPIGWRNMDPVNYWGLVCSPCDQQVLSDFWWNQGWNFSPADFQSVNRIGNSVGPTFSGGAAGSSTDKMYRDGVTGGGVGISPMPWKEIQCLNAATPAADTHAWAINVLGCETNPAEWPANYTGGWANDTRVQRRARLGRWFTATMRSKVVVYQDGTNTIRSLRYLRTHSAGTTVAPTGTHAFSGDGAKSSGWESVNLADTSLGRRNYILNASGIASAVYSAASASANSRLPILAHVWEVDPAQLPATGLKVINAHTSSTTAQFWAEMLHCTPANLAAFFAEVGVPDLIEFECGTNDAPGLVNSGAIQAFKDNVAAACAKFTAAVVANGKPPPLINLIAAYDTNILGDRPQVANVPDYLLEVASGTPGQFSFTNQYAMLPSAATLAAWGDIGGADIHPASEQGCNRMIGAIVDEWTRAAAAGSPALREMLR